MAAAEAVDLPLDLVLETAAVFVAPVDVMPAALPRFDDAASFDWADLLGRDVPQPAPPTAVDVMLDVAVSRRLRAGRRRDLAGGGGDDRA